VLGPIRGAVEAHLDVNLTVDGAPVRCPAGLTVAAALLGLHRRATRETPRLHAPRGLFCGMGVCCDCAVEIDGRGGVRACATLVREGMAVATQRGAPALGGPR